MGSSISWQTQVLLALMFVGGGYIAFVNKLPPFNNGGLFQQFTDLLPSPEGGGGSARKHGGGHHHGGGGGGASSFVPSSIMPAPINRSQPTAGGPMPRFPLPPMPGSPPPQTPNMLPNFQATSAAAPSQQDETVYENYARGLAYLYGQQNFANTGNANPNMPVVGGDPNIGTTPLPGDIFSPTGQVANTGAQLNGSTGMSTPSPYPMFPNSPAAAPPGYNTGVLGSGMPNIPGAPPGPFGSVMSPYGSPTVNPYGSPYGGGGALIVNQPGVIGFNPMYPIGAMIPGPVVQGQMGAPVPYGGQATVYDPYTGQVSTTMNPNTPIGPQMTQSVQQWPGPTTIPTNPFLPSPMQIPGAIQPAPYPSSPPQIQATPYYQQQPVYYGDGGGGGDDGYRHDRNDYRYNSYFAGAVYGTPENTYYIPTPTEPPAYFTSPFAVYPEFTPQILYGYDLGEFNPVFRGLYLSDLFDRFGIPERRIFPHGIDYHDRDRVYHYLNRYMTGLGRRIHGGYHGTLQGLVRKDYDHWNRGQHQHGTRRGFAVFPQYIRNRKDVSSMPPLLSKQPHNIVKFKPNIGNFR